MSRTVYAVHVTVVDQLYIFEEEDQARDFAAIHDARVSEVQLFDRAAAEQLLTEEVEAFEEDQDIERWEREL